MSADRRSVIRRLAVVPAKVPATLRKRRRGQAAAGDQSAEFEALLISEYPVPTGLDLAGSGTGFSHRVGGRCGRLGGNLLEHVPEPIRPRIRDRDRQR